MPPFDRWRLLLHRVPAEGAWNMAVDSAVLEAARLGDSLPTLRFYAWQPACLSLGYAQEVTEVDREALQARSWGLVRRPTGGRAVLHTDELTYSVCGAADDRILAGSVLVSYNRLATALAAALHSLGVNVEMAEHATNPGRITNPVCFEMPSAYEITCGGKKLLGSAQARRQGGVLQHGSLPLTGDLRRILQVLVHADETQRENASARLMDRATTLERALGRRVSWEAAAQAIITAFERTLHLVLEEGSLSEKEEQRARDLLGTQFANENWTEKKIRQE